MVGVCWLVVCSTLDEEVSVVDEVYSDIVCPSVVKDGEDGVESVGNDVVPSVESLSLVDASIVVVLIEDTTVVNVDRAVDIDSVSVVEVF